MAEEESKEKVEQAKDIFKNNAQEAPSEPKDTSKIDVKLNVKYEPIFKISFPDDIPVLPDEPDVTKIDVRYTVIEPFVQIHIYWFPADNELHYDVEEPVLTDKEKKSLVILRDGLNELINISFINIETEEKIIEFLEKNVRILIDEFGLKMTKDQFLKYMYYLYRDFIGLDRVEPLMQDYYIEDIELNGFETPIYIVHRKYRNLRTNVIFPRGGPLVRFVEKLAQKCGQYVSYANPLLDGVLPNGSIDFEEPIIYKKDGIAQVNSIGKFIDNYYNSNECNKPVGVQNIEVPAFDKDTLKIEWKKLDYVYRHKIDEDLFELQMEFGKKVRLTGCHSIFILTKEGVKSIRTDQLNVGDYAAIPLSIPENDIVKEINLAYELSKTRYANKLVLENIPNSLYLDRKSDLMTYYKTNYIKPYQAYYEHRKKKILPLKLYHLLVEKELRCCKIRPSSAVGVPTFLKIDENLLRLLGLYTAEGWPFKVSNTYKIYFCFHKNEVDLVDTVRIAAKKCFGLDIYVEPEMSNAVKVCINSFVLWIIFNDVLKVSKGAKTKRVPNIVFNIKNELQQEYIKYWVKGDYGNTASKKLANDISLLSLFNGDVVAFSSRQRESLFDSVRPVKSYEYATGFFVRDAQNPYSSMIPTEVLNPLNKTNNIFNNNRISKERLSKIINNKRYQRFRDLPNVNSTKFINEWTNRGFLKNSRLTLIGEELVEELDVATKLINSDLGFARIKNISRVKSSGNFVYDVSVKCHENFIGGTGGICCHNSRVNATYTEDVSSRGPTVTIRKFTKEPWTPIKLMDFKTVSPEILAYLWLLIEHRSNMLIIGGTGSGKTSFMNCLAFFIPPADRVVSIEDTRELQLKHENWLPSVSRQGVGSTTLSGQKHGEVSLFDLLKESLRQRPDYIIVGEIRGKEAFVLFQAMASGHPSYATMHAESIETLVSRLTTPPISLSPALITSLDAVCIMIPARIKGKDVRKLRQVTEIISAEEKNVKTNTPFIWDPADDKFKFKTASIIFEKIMKRTGMTWPEMLKEFKRRTQLLMVLYRKKVFDFSEVQEVIHEYYKVPDKVLERYGINIK
jgi:type IV secretory pathway ATPase VirB11/archaellum biosynthesis ATPase